MENRFERFTSLILQINRSIQHIKLLEMSRFQLKGIHAMCIFYLNQNPEGLSQAELVRLCLEDKASISRALSELSARNLVIDTQPGQQKKYNARITLTPKGLEIARQVQEKATAALNTCSGDLTDSDREAMYRSLMQISDNLEQYEKTLKK